jgi:protein TonB
MTVPFINKLSQNAFSQDSFTPVIICSLLVHALFFAGVIFTGKFLYKSNEFERPYTFELIKLEQVFEVPSQPKLAAAPRLKSATPKAATPAPAAARPEPVAETNPMPSEQKNATPAPAEAPAAPAQQASSGTGQATDAPVSIDLDKVYEAGMVDEAPVLQKKTEPFYPEFVKDQGISGTVKAQVIIDRNGTVIDIKILSSPSALLSDEVYKAVSRWKYKPGKFKGVAVKVKNRDVEIEFKLTD